MVAQLIGETEDEKIALGQVKKAAEPYSEQVEFVYMNKFSHTEMLDALSLAGKDSTVLFVRWVNTLSTTGR